MIIKERKKPRKLEFLEASIRRLPADHPKIPLILDDIGKREAGYKGEQKLDFYLSYLPEKEYFIFHDLRLPNGKSFFQIDSLVLSYTFGLAIEAKNMAGELTFDEKNNQIVQKNELRQNGYDDPLLQAKLQVRQLKDLLLQHKFPNIPIEYLVMMSNSNAVLITGRGSEAESRVCRSSQVVLKTEEFNRKHKKVHFENDTLRKLSRLLLKKHTEPSFDIEKLYRIQRSDLLTGVFCPSCCYLGMVYYQGSWHCPKCGMKSRDAYMPALKDYYLLYGPTITNQQLREFLQLDSVNVASKQLKKWNLPHTGINKHRVYHLSF